MVTAPPLHFIDVSEHQGTIDWSQVTVPAFVKIKQGVTGTDKRGAVNVAEAMRVGKLLGPYHFLSRFTPGDQQADAFVALARAYSIDLENVISMLDWESDEGAAPPFDVALAFVQRFRGLAPGAVLWLYGNEWVRPWANTWAVPFWCAAYPNPNDRAIANVRADVADTGAVAWQWSSGAPGLIPTAGLVPGIAGAVDVNELLTPPPGGTPTMPIRDDLAEALALHKPDQGPLTVELRDDRGNAGEHPIGSAWAFTHENTRRLIDTGELLTAALLGPEQPDGTRPRRLDQLATRNELDALAEAVAAVRAEVEQRVEQLADTVTAALQAAGLPTAPTAPAVPPELRAHLTAAVQAAEALTAALSAAVGQVG